MNEPESCKPNPLNIRRWTMLTWVGILLWLWRPFWLNYIQFPARSYITGPSGELILNETYDTVAEIPFPWGWPFSYIDPAVPLFIAPVPVGVAPVAPPPMPPTTISWTTLGLNVFLIAIATLALIYCSQKLFAKFSVRAMMIVMLLLALYFTVPARIAAFVGDGWGSFAGDFCYFSPLLVAAAIKSMEVLPFDAADAKRRFASLLRRAEPDCESSDEVFAFALKLDHEGQWEEAIKTYRLAAERWPEEARYANNCIAAIEVKKAAGS